MRFANVLLQAVVFTTLAAVPLSANADAAGEKPQRIHHVWNPVPPADTVAGEVVIDSELYPGAQALDRLRQADAAIARSYPRSNHCASTAAVIGTSGGQFAGCGR